MTLKLGLPSKGRLQSQCFDWFSARGAAIGSVGADREYAARMEDQPGVEIVLSSAGEVPRELALGRVHLAVTGRDLVAEQLPDADMVLSEVAALGFGHADLVIAVPAFWIDVGDLSDLDAVAAAFRARHGRRMRVATKYHRLVRSFLRANGVADYALVDSQGATEALVRNNGAELIADITSSGATLRDNHLKTLDDGLVLRSEAVLFRSLTADWNTCAREAYAALLRRIGLSDDLSAASSV